MARRRRSGGRKLLINAIEPEESRIAIIQGGRLEEYYLERQSLGSTLGNIYKARITNVEKSIGAAFVDFGHGRQGFLHVSDLCMAAVGAEAREFLTRVQAAREVAHDEDVIETPEAEADEASPETDDGADPRAEDASDEEAEEARADDGADEDEDEDDDPSYSPDDRDSSWADDVPTLDAAEVDDLSTDDVDGEETDEREVAFGPQPKQDPHPRAEPVETVETVESEVGLEGAVGLGTSTARGRAVRTIRARKHTAEPPQEATAEAAAGESAVQPATETSPEPTPERTKEEAEPEAPKSNGRKRQRGGRRGRRGGKSRKREYRQMPPIEEILEKGQEIIVQVIKDGIGTKGPTLTTFLSLPGRFIVLMPGIQKRGVSRKVTDGAERERLKGFVRELKAPDGLGFIVRTAGSDCSREDLQRDLDYLLKLWEQMRVRVREHSAPVLLYQENDLVIRTLRDLYDGQGDIVIDHAETAAKAREFVSEIMPDRVDRVQLYENEKPLFSHYGLEAELSRLLENRIELKSGGSLIIEQTEALVAIDVNSGRFKPDDHKDIDETAFAVNCEAAVEVARQLRLRDLGGVVIIDFIDMRQEKHRKQLERLFKEELRRDRARIKVARFSPFGILELTRQRVRPSLKRTVHQRCPYCVGTGFIPSDETSRLEVIRKIRDNLWRPGSVLVVTVRPEVAEAVLNDQKKALVELEETGKRQIFIRADHRLAYEDIEVRAMVALPDDMDHRRA